MGKWVHRTDIVDYGLGSTVAAGGVNVRAIDLNGLYAATITVFSESKNGFILEGIISGAWGGQSSNVGYRNATVFPRLGAVPFIDGKPVLMVGQLKVRPVGPCFITVIREFVDYVE